MRELKKKSIYYLILFNVCFSQTLDNNTNLLLEDAIKKYSNLSEKYPDKKDINYNLGNLHYYKGDLEQAIVHYNEALESKNKRLKSDAHFNLGNTYYNMEDYEKSLSEYKRALEINSNNHDARYNYEFTKRILKQEQKKQDQQQDGDQQNEEDGDKQDQQQDGDQQNEEDGDKQNQQQDDDQQNEEDGDKQDQQQDGDQQNEEDDNKKGQQKKNRPIDKDLSPEQLLEKEEAEAILNSLKANEKNLMRKKYKALKSIKVLKDW